jgi:putative CocE/NonD family hydrolase
MRICAALVLLMFAASRAGAGPSFDYRAPSSTQDPAAAASISDLASRLLPVYQDSDPERYMANLSALQMAVGDYAAADITRQSLRERRRKTDFGHPIGRAAIFDLYAHAKALEADDRITFADAFTNAYRESIRRLDDHDAFEVTRWLSTPPAAYRDSLQRAFEQNRAKDSIDEAEAIELIWKYVTFDAYKNFGALVVLLNAEEDHRRYVSEEGVLIRTADGTSIAITVTRPTGSAKGLPTLLEFPSLDPMNYAKESAAHGYAGVVAHPLAARKSSAGIDPFDFEGADAREVIAWIVKQSWSDGRVGMYGEGWSAYAPWAAAKKLPPALKAIATSAADVPGINLPMEGNIFRNSAYGWSLQMTDREGPEQSTGPEAASWQALNEKWYRSGRPYRDLGRIYGKHNPVFIRWLNHPSYDRYWQKFVPYREQFAHLNIPVLTMTGYFAASEPGDLYYFTQHHKNNPKADHTLLIGPYDEEALRVGGAADLHGYQVDSTALIDFRELRFQWFDHVLKGAAAPALLAGRVNYQVMGANEWRHAGSLEAMADSSLKFYMDSAADGSSHRLSLRKRAVEAPVQQTMGFLDRKDATWTPPTDFISKSLAPRHGTIFLSEPLGKASTFSGLFSGHLDFSVNKMDMDLNITLYELLANGDHVRLFSPTYEIRASYAADRVHRHLLKAGERQKLTFRSERLTSRQLQAGSRIAMVLSVAKRPDREINYGTGGDVSAESIADGGTPIKIRWYNDSYIEIPMGK